MISGIVPSVLRSSTTCNLSLKMITPRFSCSQNEKSVMISVYCPAIRAAEVEINVDETLFTLHVNPYYLRLNFSHKLLEDDESSAKYDGKSGYLTVTLTKEVPGQEFKDLDLLAKLLAPRKTEVAPTIEVIGQEDHSIQDETNTITDGVENLGLDDSDILEAVENDWQIKQEVPGPPSSFNTAVHKFYGFLDAYSGYFTHVTHTENEINELGADTETSSSEYRRQLRLKHEEAKWDEEYYMADYADDEMIRELINWKLPYLENAGEFSYTEKEKETMLGLPRKEYLATPTQTHDLYLTLITLLFSYAYETRTTQCDSTPESAWTLCSLTPAFSALDPAPYHELNKYSSLVLTFTTAEINATLATCYRRSLSFPLYRSWALAERCRRDVAQILGQGKRLVARCLLGMKDILDHHEVYYVYSKIWVDDFCTWIQANATDDLLQSLSTAVSSSTIAKNDIDWDLENLEEAALATDSNDSREEDSDDE